MLNFKKKKNKALAHTRLKHISTCPTYNVNDNVPVLLFLTARDFLRPSVKDLQSALPLTWSADKTCSNIVLGVLDSIDNDLEC